MSVSKGKDEEMSNVVQIAASLYNARDAMRSLYGPRYEEKVKPVVKQLNELSKAWNCSIVKVISRVSDEAKQSGALSGAELGLLFAAYVEDSEGTYKAGLSVGVD